VFFEFVASKVEEKRLILSPTGAGQTEFMRQFKGANQLTSQHKLGIQDFRAEPFQKIAFIGTRMYFL